jgi:hypothetical protein
MGAMFQVYRRASNHVVIESLSFPPRPLVWSPNMANATYFPPGTGCYVDNNFYGKWQTNCKRVGVTDAMVDFLNLTKTLDNYFAAYCNNPPEDDSCPFG